MGYLIFLLTLLLFVFIFILLAKYKEQISRKHKIIIGVCFLALAGLIGIYNTLQESESENLNTLKSAFLRQAPIYCKYQGKDILVSAENFNFSNGTMSFQGKSHTDSSHMIIPLQDCTIKEQDKNLETKEDNHQETQKDSQEMPQNQNESKSDDVPKHTTQTP